MKRRSPTSLTDPRAHERCGVTRRVLATALTAAGLYAAVLGPAGALAQDPTPSQGADDAPTAESTPQSTPSSTPTQEASPESTPTSTSTPESTSTPAGTPESTPSPEPTAVPTATALETPTATAGPEATVQALPGEAPMNFEQAIDVGEFTIDLDDPTSDARHGINGLPECTPARIARAKRLARIAKSKKAHKASASASALDCVTRTRKPKSSEIRNPDGTPTLDNPTISITDIGPAPIGVPNFMIEKFRIPPFLLPIYQAAGVQYGVRWEVLAAINEIETDYGRNLNVSSAGALGWMQFMPATWKQYGVDANKDGLKDPYNPVDAIFAAARYLRAAGAETDLYKAIFAYNHADWYVDSVLMRARLIGGLPSNFVGSLTGLTQARFPVHAKARYAGDLTERDAKRKVKTGENAAFAVESQAGRRGIKIFARRGAPVIAVNDGRIVRMGKTKRLGQFVQLQDVYGNVFTYAHLSKLAETYPSPRPRNVTREEIAREMRLPAPDAKPKRAASAGSNRGSAARKASSSEGNFMASTPRDTEGGFLVDEAAAEAAKSADPLAVASGKDRLYAHPTRPATRASGGEVQLASASYKPTIATALKLSRKDYEPKRLKKGARIIAGTILGRIGKSSSKTAPHVLFEIRPAGRGAPRIDPKPILDGWRLLESTEIYRAESKNPFYGPDAKTPSIGQILLMSKELLIGRVLANPRIEIYGCGRRDVRVGTIDRRVLATLEFLAASGLKPTVTSLKCGHGYYTASGNVSHHSSGNAVDIAAVNGIPVLGNQGAGSITEMAVQRLITLQGTMRPDQIITLMKFEGADNTYAMGDHNDHIHVGWRPLYGTNSKAAKQANAVLKPKQWIKLIDRLNEIDNPTVRQTPSKYAVEVEGGAAFASDPDHDAPASDAHAGE